MKFRKLVDDDESMKENSLYWAILPDDGAPEVVEVTSHGLLYVMGSEIPYDKDEGDWRTILVGDEILRPIVEIDETETK